MQVIGSTLQMYLLIHLSFFCLSNDYVFFMCQAWLYALQIHQWTKQTKTTCPGEFYIIVWDNKEIKIQKF